MSPSTLKHQVIDEPVREDPGTDEPVREDPDTGRTGTGAPGTSRPALLAGEERDTPERHIFRGLD
ncbi:hypothetical protein [Streptomyces poriticola]|uniref:hypothetical protein n=1 Tax=Streptomyces poriticola TaxID=3120506 RepID=UPI002FCE2E63